MSSFAKYVTTEEIYNKLPMCSMFCKHYSECKRRKTIDTVNENEVISICFGEPKIDHSDEHIMY